MKGKRIYTIIIYLLLIIGVGSLFAFWASNVNSPDDQTSDGNINVGQGNDVSTTITISDPTSNERLVPLGTIQNSQGSNLTEVIVRAFTVNWSEDLGLNAATGATGVLTVSVAQNSITLDPSIHHLLNLNFTEQHNITIGTSKTISVGATLTRPANIEEYRLLSGRTISITLELSLSTSQEQVSPLTEGLVYFRQARTGYVFPVQMTTRSTAQFLAEIRSLGFTQVNSLVVNLVTEVINDDLSERDYEIINNTIVEFVEYSLLRLTLSGGLISQSAATLLGLPRTGGVRSFVGQPSFRVSDLGIPVRENYEFNHWVIHWLDSGREENHNYLSDTEITMNENITITADWTSLLTMFEVEVREIHSGEPTNQIVGLILADSETTTIMELIGIFQISWSPSEIVGLEVITTTGVISGIWIGIPTSEIIMIRVTINNGII